MQPQLPIDTAMAFDGPELTHDDQVRLAGHLQKVIALMSDGYERTLKQIAREVRCSEASASARLRDLRQSKHGAWTVSKRRVSAGLWLYRVTK